MNWDEKVTDEAISRGLNSGTLGPVRASVEQEMARRWAQWQRDQLRSKEAVERVARVLLKDYQSQYDGGTLDEFTDLARAAIAALIGEA